MRAIWKGSLNFGLVSIDIELFSAIKEHAVSFKLLHDRCEQPIHNIHWCTACDMQVPWEHVVKGFAIAKNKFIVMSKAAIAKLKSLRLDTVVIQTFVDKAALQPLWFDQHYYAVMHKASDRAYTLFVQALKNSSKIGIGRIVMKDREHVCALQVYQDQLMLTTLYYPYEVRPAPKEKAAGEFSEQEMVLAQQLIATMSDNQVSEDLFKDTFVEKLKKIVLAGTKNAQLADLLPEKQPQRKNSSLVETLHKSLKKNQR